MNKSVIYIIGNHSLQIHLLSLIHLPIVLLLNIYYAFLKQRGIPFLYVFISS